MSEECTWIETNEDYIGLGGIDGLHEEVVETVGDLTEIENCFGADNTTIEDNVITLWESGYRFKIIIENRNMTNERSRVTGEYSSYAQWLENKMPDVYEEVFDL